MKAAPQDSQLATAASAFHGPSDTLSDMRNCVEKSSKALRLAHTRKKKRESLSNKIYVDACMHACVHICTEERKIVKNEAATELVKVA